MTKRVLVTGFDPFDGETINPSWEAVQKLKDNISDAEIIKLQLPTEFERSTQLLHSALEQYCPDVVISVGQAGGRKGITPELIAINYDDARIPDNAGFTPHDRTIHPDGENAYFTQLPVKEIVRNLQESGIEASMSTTAGTYVCNHVMYEAQYERALRRPHLVAGFIHIPYIPAQVENKPGIPALSLDDAVRGLGIAISTVIEGLQ